MRISFALLLLILAGFQKLILNRNEGPKDLIINRKVDLC